MKKKHRRILSMSLSIISMAVGIGFVLNQFKKNIVFYITPTELLITPPAHTQKIRIGGLVAAHSIQRKVDAYNTNAFAYQFTIHDDREQLPVMFKGVLPTLFREGQGIIAEGYWRNHVFMAENLLAKHDENYRPPTNKSQ